MQLTAAYELRVKIKFQLEDKERIETHDRPEEVA